MNLDFYLVCIPGTKAELLTAGFKSRIPGRWSEYAGKNMTAKAIRARVGEKVWEAAWTVAVVRNPVDLVLQRWRDIQRYLREIAEGELEDLDRFRGKSLEEWVEEGFPGEGLIRTEGKFSSISALRQKAFLSDSEGDLLVKNVYHSENLGDALGRIGFKLNVRSPGILLIDRFAPIEREDMASHDVLGAIEREFAEDMEEFGYPFQYYCRDPKNVEIAEPEEGELEDEAGDDVEEEYESPEESSGQETSKAFDVDLPLEYEGPDVLLS